MRGGGFAARSPEMDTSSNCRILTRFRCISESNGYEYKDLQSANGDNRTNKRI